MVTNTTMKIIKKLKNNTRTLLGSALLVGATVAGGAAFAAAQDNGSSGDLGDYPHPFVDEDGEVTSSVVVGETAEDGEPVSTLDVVSGIEVAGSLGNAAFTETEETVSVEGGVGEWSAENGVTLNRERSHLFLNQYTNDGESTLDDRDLDVLESTTFSSEDGEEISTDFEVAMGERPQSFDSDEGDLDDPAKYIEVPSRGDVDADAGSENNLFTATVDFSQTLDFHAAGSDDDLNEEADEWVEDGEEITLFGETYTFSDDSDDSELILYGDAEDFDVERGEEETITVDGNEHTFEVVSVSGSDEATVRVDGSLETVESGDTVRVSGSDVRVRNIYDFGDNDGVVQFGIGTDELSIQDGRVEVNEDRVRGIDVSLDDADDQEFAAIDGMTFGFGAQENDENIVEAEDSYVEPVFNGALEFHYGGLNADAAEDYAETVNAEASEDDAEFTVTNDDGETETITFAEGDGDDTVSLGGEEETIATYEGQQLDEDDFVVLNQDDDAAMYEITSLFADLDEDIVDDDDDGELELELENVFTGNTVTIEEDGIGEVEDEGEIGGDNIVSYTLDSERIEGLRFDVKVYYNEDEAEEEAVSFVRDDAADELGTEEDYAQQVFSAFYTEADGAAAFAAPVAVADLEGDYVELPSGIDETETVNLDDEEGDDTFTAGSIEYGLGNADGTGVEDGDDDDYLVVTQQDGETGQEGPAAIYVQPEDDDGDEDAFVFEAEDGDNGEINEVDFYYTDEDSEDFYGHELDSDDDVEVGYTVYGSYITHDTDDEGDITVNVPAVQSTSGMAMTGTDGALSAEGGATDGSVTSQTPTYSWAAGNLDSDDDSEHITSDDHLVLVGGPNVNSLVSDLVEENRTMPAEDYTEGEGMVQLVDGFNDGQQALIVAGHSGEDTRAAGEFLANYRDHEADLEGRDEVTISTETGQVVE